MCSAQCTHKLGTYTYIRQKKIMGTKWNNEMNFISNIWSIKVPPGEDPDRRKHVWLVKFKKLNLKIIYI